MDAKEFIRELVRMCKSNGETCAGCQIRQNIGCPLVVPEKVDADKLVEIVKSWSEVNPKKTNGQVMFDYIQKFVNDTDGDFTSLTMSPSIILEFNQGWWCKEYKE